LRHLIVAAAAMLTGAALLPAFGNAQASRHAVVRPERAAMEDGHTHGGGGITLGAMAELQRRRRSVPADAVAAASPARASWSAQLGAFASMAAAERHRAALAAKGVGADQVELRTGGGLHRLQTAPASRAEVAALCSRLKSADFDCFARPAG
jgi:hypothetical protein